MLQAGTRGRHEVSLLPKRGHRVVLTTPPVNADIVEGTPAARCVQHVRELEGCHARCKPAGRGGDGALLGIGRPHRLKAGVGNSTMSTRPSISSRVVRAASTVGLHPNSRRARLQSRWGTSAAMSSQPSGVGWKCARHDAAAAARSNRQATGTGRVPRSSAIIWPSKTGSALTLNGPVASDLANARKAAATSLEWTAWRRSPAGTGRRGSLRG